jgi:nitrite reductase/ring-hydroxylating ferredoxin subunit
VVATNVPINNRFTIHTKEAAYRTYVIGMQVPHGLMQPMLMWDTQDPYHYIRLETDSNKKEDLLIIGGEDHRVGQDQHPEENYRNLERWANETLKLHYPVTHRWSGQIVEPVDGLAFIGYNPSDRRNIFIATGDSGHGLTHGTIAGILLTDLILGKQNEWATLYNPRRKTWKEIGTYLKENINTSIQYSDWLSSGDVSSTKEIKPREGAIMSQGISRIAVYKDSDGDLHMFSATCPHLGGIVRWNTVEKSWDCPCHGSRFNCYGDVINGPANTGLTAIDSTPEMRRPPIGFQPTQGTTPPP